MEHEYPFGTLRVGRSYQMFRCSPKFSTATTKKSVQFTFQLNSPETFFVTLNNIFYLSDFNECSLNNAGCEHVCNNTGGSFNCDCRAGFKLKPDKRGCEGNGDLRSDKDIQYVNPNIEKEGPFIVLCLHAPCENAA